VKEGNVGPALLLEKKTDKARGEREKWEGRGKVGPRHCAGEEECRAHRRGGMGRHIGKEKKQEGGEGRPIQTPHLGEAYAFFSMNKGEKGKQV